MLKIKLLKRVGFCPRLLFGLLIVVIALVSLLSPPMLCAQQDEKQQARLLWAVGNQMGSVHWASFYNNTDGTLKSLRNIVQLLQSTPCMDAAPWQNLLTRLQAGASPRSLFADIIALETPPLDPGSVGVSRYTCQCISRTAASQPQWRYAGIGDCYANDVDSTGGNAPDPTKCNAPFLGKTAICWDGAQQKHYGTNRVWCTYKNIGARSCVPGNAPSPGYVYECVSKD